ISECVPPELLEQVQRALEAKERSWIEAAAAYPEDSVARLMTPNPLAVREDRTVGEAIEQIRARGELSRYLDTLFVVDSRNLLRGVVPVRALLLHDVGRPIRELAGHAISFQPADTAEAAAEAFSRYDLVCAPVLDGRGKLFGALTVDAMLDSIRARTTREMQRMGGVEALDAPYDQVAFWPMVRKRGGWLAALFLGEMLTATAMGIYEAEIARAVVLALFVPLIISSGGNSGSQATSL